MMMAFGMFIFKLDTIPYQTFKHQMGWRHPSTSRVGKRPARQFVGQDDESITLTGVLYPELTGGQMSLDLLRLMGDGGKAWPLIEGTGQVYGFFALEKLGANKSFFFPDGAARKIEFDITLVRVGDDDMHKLGALTRGVMSLVKPSLPSITSMPGAPKMPTLPKL
jgi:phage protein U